MSFGLAKGNTSTPSFKPEAEARRPKISLAAVEFGAYARVMHPRASRGEHLLKVRAIGGPGRGKWGSRESRERSKKTDKAGPRIRVARFTGEAHNNDQRMRRSAKNCTLKRWTSFGQDDKNLLIRALGIIAYKKSIVIHFLYDPSRFNGFSANINK